MINDDETQNLFEIQCDEERFQIIPNSFEINHDSENESLFKSLNTSWFIFKSNKTIEKPKNYKLNEGDILKIGRITAIIREIKINNNQINNNNNNINNTNKNDISFNTNVNIKDNNFLSNNYNIIEEKKVQKTKKKRVCRICYIEEDTEENPLIQPCICSGSMKYIHLNCLKHWISTKSLIKMESNNNFTKYKIKPVECELCKSKLPDYIRHNSKLYCILDHSDYENYISIEYLSIDKRKNRFLYIGNLENKKEIKIGRGHNSDIIFNDVSVSRLHCKLLNTFNGIYIEDNNSKFGTLILIQTPILHLNESLPLYMQVGRTFMHIKIKRPFSLFGCCNILDEKNEYFYHNQNEKQIDYHKNIIIKEENENDDDDYDEEINVMNNSPKLNVIEIDQNTYKKDNKENENHGYRITNIDDNENTETQRNDNQKDIMKTVRTVINEEGE